MRRFGAFVLFFAFAGAVRWMLAQNENEFSLALTGDSIITRRMSVYQEPEFTGMVDIIRQADAAFTNLEMLFHDYESYPMHQSGGTYMRAEPALIKELVWMGFDMVSLANNHTGDYGVEGMRLTQEYVEEAGLLHAGAGQSLAEAREAKFLETAKARLALISVASTFPDHSRAGKTRGDIPPRPGLNPLRHETIYRVQRPHLESLHQILQALGLASEKADDGRLRFLGNLFVESETNEVDTKPDPEDLEEISAVVANASRLADLTVVSIHAHEGDRDRFIPARFLVTFARAMIDAGADVLVGHGPHVLRAIEIYKGKPVFYSLGDFIFQNETLLRLPYENYESFALNSGHHVADFNDARYDHGRRGFPAQREIWEAVVAVPRFAGKTLRQIWLYPISLGFGQPPAVRGRPMLAERSLGKKIIDDLVRLSRPFGTEIAFEDGFGIIRVGQP